MSDDARLELYLELYRERFGCAPRQTPEYVGAVS